MGYIKRTLTPFINKRNFYLIKTYAYYRKDIWGFMKLKRLYKYRKAIYSMLKRKKRYYGMMLYRVYRGIKFFNKDITYKSNLFFIKKRVKLFYNSLKDKSFVKMGLLVKRRFGILINYFYSLLERRVDVILYRTAYALTVRFSHNFINNGLVFLNKKVVVFPGSVLLMGCFLRVRTRYLVNPFFFRYRISRSLETYKWRNHIYNAIKNVFVDWDLFNEFSQELLPRFFRLSYSVRSFRNKKKLVLRLLKKLPFILYCYMYFLLKKLKRFKVYRKRKPFAKMKKPFFAGFFIAHIYIIFELCNRFYYLKKAVYRYLSVTFRYNLTTKNPKLKKLLKKQLWKPRPDFLQLYGVYNIRIRLKKMFYILRPRWYNRVFTRIDTKRRYKIFFRKVYRFWKFSKNAYMLFKNLPRLYFVYKGYLSHFEVNYKIHVILLVTEPKLNTITHNFGLNKWSFFDYLRRKAYF